MKKIFTLIISLQMIASSVFAQQTPTAGTDDITIGKQTWKSKNLQVATFADEKTLLNEWRLPILRQFALT